MIVCGHGDVTAFCQERDMVICEQYQGDLEDYRGCWPVLVTSKDMSEHEYHYLKSLLFSRGIELISTIHRDTATLRPFLEYQATRRKRTNGGRNKFGFRRENGVIVPTTDGMVVVKRILEMRDAGYTLSQISEDEGVHHPDGRKICISTIQQIIKNREKYGER